jgi:RNA polymerase sigma factor, sigma-70 family
MNEYNDIYELYGEYVYRFLLCLSSSHQIAEELTQETFYQAVKSIRRYNGTCKISVWLCQIAKHVYYDYLKREKYRRHVSFDDITENVSDEVPEETFISKEAVSEIWSEINKLEDSYREVLICRINHDMSFKEIGVVMGKSENWARVTYYRAKKKLEERIKSYDD